LVGGFEPDEGFGVSVSEVDVLADGVLEFERAAMDAAAQLSVGQVREESLDLVDPGCALGREVEMEVRVSYEPAFDQWRPVGPIVVEDQMDVRLARDVAVDTVKELAELDAAMTPVMLGGAASVKLHF